MSSFSLLRATSVAREQNRLAALRERSREFQGSTVSASAPVGRSGETSPKLAEMSASEGGPKASF